MATISRRKTSNPNAGGFAQIIDAMTETRQLKQESDFKIRQIKEKAKADLVKRIIEKRMEAASDPTNPASPQQRFLQKRLQSEKPFSQQIGMTEDPNQTFEMSMPADRVVQSGTGVLQTKDTDPDSKDSMLGFMTAYDKRIQAGQPVHPVATKIYERMKEKVNRSAFGKETVPATGERKASEWKSYIDSLEKIRPSRRTTDQETNLLNARKKYDEIMFGGNTPELPADQTQGRPAAEQDPLEGKTATNPETKQKVIRKSGQWVPIS